MMDIRKVSIDEEDVIRKRRVSRHPHISFWSEEFDCGGHTSPINYRKKSSHNKKDAPNFGISKMETYISSKYLVNGHVFYIKGNSV